MSKFSSNTTKLLILIMTLSTSIELFAAGGGGGSVAFHLPFLFRTRSESVNGASPSQTQFFDIVPSLGYQYSELLYFGVNYRYTNETGSGSEKLNGGVYGPSIGLTVSNVNFSFAYYVGGDLTQSNSGTDTVYGSGSGFEFGVAYLFPVASSFAWGPQFVYSDIKYTSTKVAGVTSSSTFEISGVEPSIALFFYF